jgi:hypothetical protein
MQLRWLPTILELVHPPIEPQSLPCVRWLYNKHGRRRIPRVPQRQRRRCRSHLLTLRRGRWVHTIRTFQGHHRQSRPRITDHEGPGKGQRKSVAQSALSQTRPDDVCEFKLAHGVESAQYHDGLGIELDQAVSERVSIHAVHKIRCGID